MTAEAIPPQGPQGPNQGPNFRAPQPNTGGSEYGQVIEGNFTVNDSPEAGAPVADAQTAQKIGRFAALANTIESAGNPDAEGRVSRMFERGAPAMQTLREKFAARRESLKATFADARRLGRAVRQNGLAITFGAAGMAKEATVNYAKETASYYGEAARNAGRAAVDRVVAYGHDVAENYNEVKAQGSFKVENAAKGLRNRSERKAAKHEARLTERMAKVEELATTYADAKDKDRVVKMATTKLKGRWASFRANRSATKMSNKNSRAYSRNQRYEKWADRTTRLAHAADAHQAAAAERRK